MCSAKLDLKKLGPDLDLVDAAHLELFPAVSLVHVRVRASFVLREYPALVAAPPPFA